MGKSAKIIIAVALTVVVVLLAYLHFKDWHDKSIEEVIIKEKIAYQKETEKLEEKLTKLEKELAAAEGKPVSVSEEKLAAAFGSDQIKVQPVSNREALPIEDIEKKLAAFFAYIDKKKYVTANKLEGESHGQFQTGVRMLTENPPIITGETDNIFRILKNLAHFYSVLGKNRVNLARDILNNEQDLIENAMRIFYLWFNTELKDLKKYTDRPSEEMLYFYSGYFLQTIGGRGYLMRRDSKTRTLAYHYCVLLLDKANTEKLNSLGIDIRPHINTSLNNVSYQMGLAYRQTYLTELNDLRRKYKMVNDS